MFNMAIEMNKAHPPDPAHIIYMSNYISDVGYFAALQAKGSIGLKEIRKKKEPDTEVTLIKNLLKQKGVLVKNIHIEVDKPKNATATTATKT